MQNLTTVSFGNITRIEYHGQLVLTTAQLAEILSSKGDRVVTVYNLSANFKNNESRFIEGKHYFKLEGEELNFLRSKNFYPQISPMTRVLYLWTKRGVARHCKSVNSEVAWDVYEALEDAYFNQVPDRSKMPSAPFDFEIGKELSKLASRTRDPFKRERLVAVAANLLKGEEMFAIPHDEQLKLFR